MNESHPKPEWYLLLTGRRTAPENMAIDEALLTGSSGIGHPVLRFYGWTEPAASFGYFQKYADVERLTPLRPLVRRPTGGGIVPHDRDWTYSLVFPPNDPWYSIKAVESYQRIHEWIQGAFNENGLKTLLAPAPRKEAIGQCFVGAERFDLLWKERKIAGAAQRRTRQGLLVQGSIQPPAGVERDGWLKQFCLIATKQWGVQWKGLELSAELLQAVGQLVEQKYGRAEYNRRK